MRSIYAIVAALVAFVAVIWISKTTGAANIAKVVWTDDSITWRQLGGTIAIPNQIGVEIYNDGESIRVQADLTIDGQFFSETVTIDQGDMLIAWPVLLTSGGYTAEIYLYEEGTMALLDSKTVTFTVQGVTPPPPPPAEAPADITDIKAQVGSVWSSINGLKFDPGTLINLRLFWKNTSSASVKATAALKLTKPSGAQVDATLVSTTATYTVTPSSSRYISFKVLADVGGAWSIVASVDGDLV